jgi:hypothetical protein
MCISQAMLCCIAGSTPRLIRSSLADAGREPVGVQAAGGISGAAAGGGASTAFSVPTKVRMPAGRCVVLPPKANVLITECPADCCRFRGDTADSSSTQSSSSKQQQAASPADDFGIPPATEADGERWRELPDAVFAEVITKISAKDLG